jgi:hypothetical protein
LRAPKDAGLEMLNADGLSSEAQSHTTMKLLALEILSELITGRTAYATVRRNWLRATSFHKHLKVLEL